LPTGFTVGRGPCRGVGEGVGGRTLKAGVRVGVAAAVGDGDGDGITLGLGLGRGVGVGVGVGERTFALTLKLVFRL